jgi:hypothetical protein
VLVDRLALIGAALMLVVAIMLALSGRPGASTLLSSLLLLLVGYALLRTSLGLRAPVLQLLGWLGALAAAGFIVISQAWVWGLFAAGNADRFAQWGLSCSLAAFAAFATLCASRWFGAHNCGQGLGAHHRRHRRVRLRRSLLRCAPRGLLPP